MQPHGASKESRWVKEDMFAQHSQMSWGTDIGKTLTCQAITEAARRGFKDRHSSIHKDSIRQGSPSMLKMYCNTMKEHTEVAGLSPSGSFAASTESESTVVEFVVAHQVR